eukprot:gene50769-62090_t
MLALLAGFGLSDRPFWNFIGEMIWNPSTNFVLVSVPLFLLMGEILLRAGLSDRLYRALNVWLNRLPGGLLHTNIVSCAVFSAISGSSVATAATMGSVALPYFQGTAYNQRWVLGSLAAGGALGNLIPPGITFIIYGLITETSVGQLYTPQDADQLMFYKEDKHGQILQEGINEPGAMSSWIAAATAYSTHGVTMIPFYIYYSMFGFQRVGDLAWAAGDMQARGFLLGGTSGRTTLNGEGLQHEDGHSHILSATIPNCVSYDPSFAHEVAVIVQDGLRRMV